jgi:hypothetical protein
MREAAQHLRGAAPSGTDDVVVSVSSSPRAARSTGMAAMVMAPMRRRAMAAPATMMSLMPRSARRMPRAMPPVSMLPLDSASLTCEE